MLRVRRNECMHNRETWHVCTRERVCDRDHWGGEVGKGK